MRISHNDSFMKRIFDVVLFYEGQFVERKSSLVVFFFYLQAKILSNWHICVAHTALTWHYLVWMPIFGWYDNKASSVDKVFIFSQWLNKIGSMSFTCTFRKKWQYLLKDLFICLSHRLHFHNCRLKTTFNNTNQAREFNFPVRFCSNQNLKPRPNQYWIDSLSIRFWKWVFLSNGKHCSFF